MYPVLVETVGGRFQASLLGAPAFRADGATKDDAVAALRADLEARLAGGQLVWVDVPRAGEPAGPPPYTPEVAEATEEMIAEIYRQRDAEKAAEFPE